MSQSKGTRRAKYKRGQQGRKGRQLVGRSPGGSDAGGGETRTKVKRQVIATNRADDHAPTKERRKSPTVTKIQRRENTSRVKKSH